MPTISVLKRSVMDLHTLPREPELWRVQCVGSIIGVDADSPDLMKNALGPDCYTYKVLLSLELASSIDSEGIGWLVRMHKQFQKAGGKMVLHSMPQTVDAVLRVMRMDRLLHMARTEQEARALALGQT